MDNSLMNYETQRVMSAEYNNIFSGLEIKSKRNPFFGSTEQKSIARLTGRFFDEKDQPLVDAVSAGTAFLYDLFTKKYDEKKMKNSAAAFIIASKCYLDKNFTMPIMNRLADSIVRNGIYTRGTAKLFLPTFELYKTLDRLNELPPLHKDLADMAPELARIAISLCDTSNPETAKRARDYFQWVAECNWFSVQYNIYKMRKNQIALSDTATVTSLILMELIPDGAIDKLSLAAYSQGNDPFVGVVKKRLSALSDPMNAVKDSFLLMKPKNIDIALDNSAQIAINTLTSNSDHKQDLKEALHEAYLKKKDEIADKVT